MDELLVERYTLASERVREVMDEKLVPEPYQDFFRKYRFRSSLLNHLPCLA